MCLYFNIQLFFLTFIYYVCVIRTEVPEYCLQPLNRDDCGLKPIAVMTYWKPGSRCEIDIWKGCPTVNKFEDEYNCTATCIFHVHKPIDECGETMDTNKCDDIEQAVYTYEKGMCVPTIWRGCLTLNKFINRTVCVNACAHGQWQDELESMPIEHLKKIDNILDNIVEEVAIETTITETTTEANITTTTETNIATTTEANIATSLEASVASDSEKESDEIETTTVVSHEVESEAPTTVAASTTTEDPTTTSMAIDEIGVITT